MKIKSSTLTLLSLFFIIDGVVFIALATKSNQDLFNIIGMICLIFGGICAGASQNIIEVI